jgi:hypothetical protein
MLLKWAKFAGFSALLATVLTISILWALHPSKDVRNYKSAEKNQTENQQCEIGESYLHCIARRTVTDPVALFTAWVAGFTAILGLSTIGLWCATNNALRLATEEFRATHRPQIRIKHFFLANDIWGGEPIVVNITLVNNGTAEAIPRQIGLKYFVVSKDRQLPIEPSITPIRHGTGERMPIGKNMDIPNVDIGRMLTDQENADIQQGRSRLFAVGYVSYEDIAGETRITGFCRVLTFPQDAIAHVGNCRFRRFCDPDYEYED